MASKLKVFQIPAFNGGLNVYASSTEVKDSESPDLLNMVFTGINGAKKRQGYTRLTTNEVVADHKIQGEFAYITNTANEHLWVSNGVLYKDNGSGGSTEITGGTFNATAKVEAAQIGTRLYLVDGVSALQYYDGSNIVTTGIKAAPSAPSQIIAYNSRIYVLSASNRDRIYYGGAVGKDGTSTDTGVFTVGAAAGYFGLPGRQITKFAKQGSSLYVWTRNSIERIDVVAGDTMDHSQVLISSSLGSISPRSIDNVENDIFFMANTIYSLGEVARYVTIRTTNVSGSVKAMFDGMAKTALENMAGIYYPKEQMYLIAYQQGSSHNDRVLAYQLPYKAWTLFSGLSVNCWLEHLDSNNVRHLYFGSDDADSSRVYEMFQGTNDAGAAINAYYKTKEYDIKQFNIDKIFQNYSVQFGSVYGVMTIDFYVNGVVVDNVEFNAGSTIGSSDGWGTQPMGTFIMGIEGNFTESDPNIITLANDWKARTLPTSPLGTTFQVKFSNNVLDESFEIRQMSVGYLEMPYYEGRSDREI